MRTPILVALSTLLAVSPAVAQDAVDAADQSVASKIDALDALLGGIDGKTNAVHNAFGQRGKAVVYGLLGKKGAKQTLGDDTVALLTGEDGLKGTLGKGGPIDKSRNLLGSLHSDYQNLGDRKRLKTVKTMQSRLDRIEKTTKSLASIKTLAFGSKTQKNIRGLRKDLKAMKKDTGSLRAKK